MLAHHSSEGPKPPGPGSDVVDLCAQQLVSGWPRFLPEGEDVEIVLPGHALYEPQVTGDHPVGPRPIHSSGKEHGDLHTAASTPSYAARSTLAPESIFGPSDPGAHSGPCPRTSCTWLLISRLKRWLPNLAALA